MVTRPIETAVEGYQPLPVYMGRWRGVYPADHVFVVCTCDQKEEFHLNPVQYTSTPEELFDRLLQQQIARVNVLRAGGWLCRDCLNFTLTRVAVLELRMLVVRVFRTRQPHVYGLDRFLDAAVFVRSQSAGWGTIREILQDQRSTH